MSATARVLWRTAVGARDARGVAREALYAGLGRIPGGDAAFESWRHPDRRVAHPASSDIVVEGYPGSGNTWMVQLLLVASPELRIASHRHRSAALREAVRRGIPAILLVRQPIDAIASILVRQPGTRADVEVVRYQQFYRRCRSIADQVVVATFEQATDAGHLVLERVNARYGLALKGDQPDDLQRAAMANIQESDAKGLGRKLVVERAATPSAARSKLLPGVRDRVRAEHADELAACSVEYDFFAGVASRQAAEQLRRSGRSGG